tara:strand:+ start:28389 stop:28988 length:600 start_codon:yes stop_codon:yes gene_type:complete
LCGRKGEMNNLLSGQAHAFYFPNFIEQEESRSLLNRLDKELLWRQESIKIFGKLVPQPRLISWQSDLPYKYSGLILKPTPWTSTILELKEKVEAVSGELFNSCLINKYRDGSDYMGWHRDNEKELGSNPVVTSLSLGAERVFKFRKKEDKSSKVSISLKNGSLLVMGGTCQHEWEHGISKTSRPTEPRINVTFRHILET